MNSNNIKTATYSPEDNKLRLYLEDVEVRLSEDVYQEINEAGFKWAPIQKLFVASRWTPARADLCIKMAGRIVAEEFTLVERAELKSDRLDALADKRAVQANAYQNAALNMATRLSDQPVLAGHHSQRRTEKAKKQVEKASEKAELAASAVNYWYRRAEGVERHANMKSDPYVRHGRIKTLLAELRDRQRDINHGNVCFELWSKISKIEDLEKKEKYVRHYLGAGIATGNTSPEGLYSQFCSGEVTWEEALDASLQHAQKQVNCPITARWIEHILNRLGYERCELGNVSRYSGKLTATILKAFARENGAHKPEAEKVDGEWQLSSFTPLPLHISSEKWLVLEDDAWRDLMQNCGYEVPAPKASAPSLLNFKAAVIKVKLHGQTKELRQIEMTKAEYSDVYKDYRGAKPSECGKFRVKICKDPHHQGEGWAAEWVAVYLTDSKAHPTPISDSVVMKEEEAA